MIVIDTDVRGIEELINIANSFNVNAKEIIPELIIDELWNFAETIHNDPDVPAEFKEALSLTVIPHTDEIILWIYSPDKFAHKDFGSRREWMLYNCPKRKYYGGKLSAEYNGPDYLRDKWTTYKATFINNIRQRIINSIRLR